MFDFLIQDLLPLLLSSWEKLLIILAAKLLFCLFFAVIDMICNQSTRHVSSSFSWIKILLFNTIWLWLGGLFVGCVQFGYGIVLLITVTMIPFGWKLLELIFYTSLPFGREIRRVPNSAESFGIFGGKHSSVLWRLMAAFIGLPIAL